MSSTAAFTASARIRSLRRVVGRERGTIEPWGASHSSAHTFSHTSRYTGRRSVRQVVSSASICTGAMRLLVTTCASAVTWRKASTLLRALGLMWLVNRPMARRLSHCSYVGAPVMTTTGICST